MPSNWPALATLCQEATQRGYDEAATYTPPGGAAVPLGVIFDAAHQDVVLEGDIAVGSTFPAAGVLLVELPGGAAAEGAALTVRGLNFTVTEIRPDGQGAALLKLKAA